jgi:outer membrane protein OmpA-like peptidoglycan-associated protein
MFRRQVFRQVWIRQDLGAWRNRLIPAAFLCGIALVALSAGCATKSTTQTANTDLAAETGGPQPDGSLHGASGDLVDPNRQIRWSYGAMPAPAPSSQPDYLLKSFRCEKGSASLNNEARGTLGQLVETLKAKPSVRVFCVGLCDGHAEKVNAQNLAISRAQAAKQFLVNQGIPKDRVETGSFAATQAKAGPDETIGQAEERRVEVWLLSE